MARIKTRKEKNLLLNKEEEEPEEDVPEVISKYPRYPRTY